MTGRAQQAAMIPTAEQIIREHLTYLEASGLSANTVEDADRLLHAADRELPAGLIGAYPEELTAWLANPTWSAQTKATYRQHLVRFYDWATQPEDPWMTYNPALGLRRPPTPPGIPRPATDGQVRRAITELPWPWRLHCILASYEGLRCIEIARLPREDVTEQITYVHGKGNRRAALPTHPLVWETVRDLPDGPITSKLDGRPATADWVSRSTRAHLHRLGLPVGLHRFRHWFGTTVQRRYRDLRVTQELLRHVSPSSSAVYTQVADEDMREALACLPDFTDRTPEV